MNNRANIFAALKTHLSDKRHSILIGARQVGKTTVVKQILTYLKEQNQKVFFLTFEDSEILSEVNIHPENIFKFTIHPDDLMDGERLYIIIDEVQYAKDATNLLKLLYDKYENKVKIIATGSSAFYINRDFKDSLAGRKKIFELYTLSFEEFLAFKEIDGIEAEYKAIQKRPEFKSGKGKFLKLQFEEYLTYGGYPAVVLEPNINYKKELLADLVNSYMKKDALESNLKDELKFFNLVRILAHQTGDLVNQNELANTLKTAVGTIDNYLYVLQKCFHIHLLTPKFGNIRKELTKMPKVYFNDLGVRNHLCNSFDKIDQRMDKGSLIENYVYTRLRDLHGLDMLHFWRTADGNEVDFIVEENIYKGKAYEVKYAETQFNANKYKKFKTAYPNFEFKPLVYEQETNDSVNLFLL